MAKVDEMAEWTEQIDKLLDYLLQSNTDFEYHTILVKFLRISTDSTNDPNQVFLKDLVLQTKIIRFI